MRIICVIFLSICFPSKLYCQGLNSHWLLGYNTGINEKSRFVFDGTSYLYNLETRPMQFWGTEANISDDQGNFLMSSNGVWIANANNDTMMNGAGLNPSYLVNVNPDGIPLNNGNLFLTYPGDSTKILLFHKTAWGQFSISLKAIYKSVIDLTLDNGLGAVIQKNDTVIFDTLSWGIAACKHGNGRDWWVVVVKDGNPEVYKLLVTPNGIESITTQSLNFISNTYGNVSQLVFTNNGNKFAYSTPINQTQSGSILLADFDRCTGDFSNIQVINVSTFTYLYGLAFSPSGEYLYTCSSGYIFQINSNTLSVDTVAVYDGFISGFPPNCCATSFWGMYLAANGKIYITSGSSVQHLHEMNFPDSAGVACDVQQHSINLGMWSLRAVPNHPNYYLGPLTGSPCDTLTGINEFSEDDFKFSISPNPSNGNFKIMYLLPQNQQGMLDVFDVNGKRVYEMNLAQWSTTQIIQLPENISSGIYNCVISSNTERTSMKIAVINE